MSENDGVNPQTENSIGQEAGKAVKEQATKQISKKLQKEATKNASKMALKGAISHIMMYVFVALVIFIIVVGIIMFLVTMPGMVMEKLKSIFKAVGNYVAAFFGADTTEQIDDVQIYETLDYLEDMGYDLKGEGFLSGYETLEDLERLQKEDKDAGYTLDKKQGVIRDADGNIAEAKSDFIFTYIMSDNYIYTLKNDNLVTKKENDGNDTFWKKIEDLGKSIATAWYKIRNFTFSPLFDALGITDAAVDKWGKGMLVIYKEEGGVVGVAGTAKQTKETLFDWDTIKIDTESKKLSIKRKTFLNNNNAMEFSLDGWTGRYGMPLEFLLSVHKATGMPDLAVDMVNSFPTEINIILHKTSGEAITAYKCNNGEYVEAAKLNKALTGVEGRNIFSKVWSWFDNLIDTEKEALIAFELGIDHAPNCTCEKEEVNGYVFVEEDGSETVVYKYENGSFYREQTGGTEPVDSKNVITNTEKHFTKICDDCRKYVGKVVDCLVDNVDYNFAAYTPYISNVKNHWYRDVYFVINNETKNNGVSFVQYDYDYEAVMKERWTLYETYTNNPADGYKYNPDREGEFILFVIDENGDFQKDGSGNYVLFDGKIEDARPSTLYEKNDKGEYVEYTGNYNNTDGKTLYRKNSAYTLGSKTEKEYVEYTGTVAVTKKAVELDITKNENLKDLGWNNKQDASIWTAYEIKDTTSGYEPLYTDEEIAEETDESLKQIMKKCYINLNLTGNIVQTGEGLRTETNPNIKKMFLQNNYFKYDGSTDTAEVITKLREKVYEARKNDSENKNKVKYGPLTDEEREMYITENSTDIDGNDKETKYYVKDYSGKVVLSQDSLNAFSMLENTHTLDADYIYRDFKELIVELGYFEKEELTDETPRLLQFPVPEIGSGGYPNRTIDKRNNEKGTMIHSKYDIDSNEKNTAMYLLTKYLEFEGEGDPNSGNTDSGNNTANSGVLASAWQDTKKIDSVLGSVGAVTPEEAIAAGEQGSGDYSSSVSGITVDEFLAKAREICEYMDNEGYDYCVSDPSGCDHQVHSNSCGLPTTFEASKSLKNVCCATLVSWVLRDVGVNMDECTNQNYCPTLVPYLVNQLGGEVISEYSDLEPGDILCYIHTSDKGKTLGHVDILGEEEGDGFLKYNGGHYVTSSNSSIGTFNKSKFDSEYLCFGVRLFGSAKKEGTYEGFLGNEAVVSPVTGILLEYGTYSNEDIDVDAYINGETTKLNNTEGTTDEEKVTKEPNRVNVDLKYGPDIKIAVVDDEETNTGSGSSSTTNETEDDRRIVVDEVGYARILVLDKESYEKLEKNTNTKWKTYNDSQGLLSDNGVYSDAIFSEEDLDEQKEKEEDAGRSAELMETVYGYKEFAERYEMAGLSGYIIQIDGFKTELPDENFTIDEDEDNPTAQTAKPQGKALTIDSFKVEPSKITDENENIISLYEADDEYKMASEKATKKLNVENTIKTDAAPAITADGLIFIKEGTVIGRTYTDREVIEDLRNEEIADYKGEAKDSTTTTSTDELEPENDKLVGNYLRVIMTNEDKEVVEDVENYMKLDEEAQSEPNDWELFFWLPFESGGTDEDGCGPESQGTCSEGETAVGIIQWTVLTSKNMNNISSQFITGCLEEDASLCAPLAAYKNWSAQDFWNDYSGGSKQFQKTLSAICDTDRDKFLSVQMEVAKKQYLEPLLEEYPWLEERPSCVQGAVMHLRVWGASTSWMSGYANSSDEDIVLKVRNTIANTSSTAGAASGDESSGRAYNEPQIALEILSGAASTEDIEQWVRKRDTSVFNFKFK